MFGELRVVSVAEGQTARITGGQGNKMIWVYLKSSEKYLKNFKLRSNNITLAN